jgi:hypothetical protein
MPVKILIPCKKKRRLNKLTFTFVGADSFEKFYWNRFMESLKHAGHGGFCANELLRTDFFTFLTRHLSLHLNGLTVDPDIQVEIGDSNINMEEI